MMDSSRDGGRPVSGQKGFTLIETLVAVMILATSLVVVMQLFSGGLKSNKLAKDYLFGIFHAKEKMEELLLRPELIPGKYSGNFDDGYQWQAIVTPVEMETEVLRRMPIVVMRIILDIHWQLGVREKKYTIETMTLINKQRLKNQLE